MRLTCIRLIKVTMCGIFFKNEKAHIFTIDVTIEKRCEFVYWGFSEAWAFLIASGSIIKESLKFSSCDKRSYDQKDLCDLCLFGFDVTQSTTLSI
jgi:hypothetical protein